METLKRSQIGTAVAMLPYLLVWFCLCCSYTTGRHIRSSHAAHDNHRLVNASSSSFMVSTDYRHVTEDDCRNLTAAECERLEHFYEVTSIQQQLYDVEEYDTDTEKLDYRGRHRHLLYSPQTGKNIKVFMLLVQFTDHADRDLPDPSYYKELCDGKAPSATNPVGSLRDYFKVQSHDEYVFTCEVSGWHMTDNTEESYSQNCKNRCTTPNQAQSMAHAAMDKAEVEMIKKYGQFWWTQFDEDMDYNFDMFLIIHSGYSAISVRRPICDGTPDEKRIQTQARPVSHSGWSSQGAPRITVRSFAIASGFEDGNCGTPNAKLGIIAHEMAHLLGAPDLYDTSIGSTGNLGGLADFDLMASLRGPGDTTGSIPGSLSPYAKITMGWGVVIDIEEDGEYEIEDVAISDQIFRIKHGYKEGEYLLIENRQKKNFDKSMFGSGILMYHIDESIDGNNGGSAVPGDSNWPKKHYLAAVLQKDGKFNIEKGENSGDEGDYWTYLDTITPGGPKGDIQPNTDSYYNGSTGVSIRVMSNPQSIMTIFVSGISDPALTFPAPPVTSTPKPTPVPTRSPTAPPTKPPTKPPTPPPVPAPTPPPTLEPTPASAPEQTSPPIPQPTAAPAPGESAQPVTVESSPPIPQPTTAPVPGESPQPIAASPTSNAPVVQSPSDNSDQDSSLTPTGQLGATGPPQSVQDDNDWETSRSESNSDSQSNAADRTSVKSESQANSADNGSGSSKQRAHPAWLVSYIGFGAVFVGAFYAMRHLLRRLNDLNAMETTPNPSGEKLLENTKSGPGKNNEADLLSS